MFKIQIAYKLSDQQNELSFQILKVIKLSDALDAFEQAFPTAIIYCILRCGKNQ